MQSPQANSVSQSLLDAILPPRRDAFEALLSRILPPREYHLPGQHDQCDHSPTGECVDEDFQKKEREIVKRARPKLKELGDNLFIQGQGTKSDIVKRNLSDLQRLSTKTLRRVKDGGIRLYVGDGPMTQLDANGKLAGVQPRGWSKGSTWDDVAGAYSPGTGIVSAGKGRSGSASTILHETGHAIGHKLGYDDHPKLIAAHKRLYGRLDPYLQQGGPGGAVGRQEFFAESVAVLFKQGPKRAVEAYDKEWIFFLKGELS